MLMRTACCAPAVRQGAGRPNRVPTKLSIETTTTSTHFGGVAALACAAALSRTPTANADLPCPGDMNGDGVVDALDVAIVEDNSGTNRHG